VADLFDDLNLGAQRLYGSQVIVDVSFDPAQFGSSKGSVAFDGATFAIQAYRSIA
jgi:hypothetical protein